LFASSARHDIPSNHARKFARPCRHRARRLRAAGKAARVARSEAANVVPRGEMAEALRVVGGTALQGAHAAARRLFCCCAMSVFVSARIHAFEKRGICTREGACSRVGARETEDALVAVQVRRCCR